MDNKLKPCPFCGGEDLDVHVGVYNGRKHESVTITCRDCLGSIYGSTEERAVKDWNTRAERTCELRNLPGGYYATAAVQCSECHAVIATTDREWECCEISYCPNCGRKVER